MTKWYPEIERLFKKEHVFINLSEDEELFACRAARLKFEQASQYSTQPKTPNGTPNWSWHAQGYCAELAVAKYLELEWNSPSYSHTALIQERIADVGVDVEVRSTTLSDGHLLVRDEDERSRSYVFVLVPSLNRPGNRMYCIVGYCFGHFARTRFELRPGSGNCSPSYWVPQSALSPMRWLKQWVHAGGK